jgi:hypothetical protein
MLGDILKVLDMDVIGYIFQFLKDESIFRAEAIEIIQHIQIPQNLELDVYIQSLKNKVSEYIQFQNPIRPSNPLQSLREQSLLLRLERWNFWSNRHSSPEAQHAFDSQHGLTIVP